MTTTPLELVDDDACAAVVVAHWGLEHAGLAELDPMERLVCPCGRSWLLACGSCGEGLIVQVDGEPCEHAARRIS